MRPSRRWIAIACAGAIAAGILFGALRARAVGRRAERFIARGIRFEIRDPPAWLPAADIAALERPAVLPAAFSIFDRRIHDALRAWYAGQPWVERVLWVGPIVPGSGGPGVAIALRLRAPLAAVWIGGREGGPYLWVDREGRCLGTADSPPSTYRLPAIAGVAFDGDPPAPGEAFGLRAVTEGIAVVELLRRGGILQRDDRRIERVDVARVGRRDVPELSLVLDDGRILDWGRGPASRFPSVLLQEEILENLRAVLDRGIGRPGEPFPLYRPLELELARRRREGLALSSGERR